MSVPTFPCPSGETCYAPECCAHQQCMHAVEAEAQPQQSPNCTHLESKGAFNLAFGTFFKLFPHEPRVDGSDPRMVVLFELIDKAAEAAKASVDRTDTEILDFMEARALEVWGEGGGWSSSESGAPSYIDSRNEVFPYATLRESALAAMRGDRTPAETPFSECVNTECPIGCPESHATPPSYWAMVDADAEPDEPVVQEKEVRNVTS